MRRSNSGYTLIEMMTVLAVVSIVIFVIFSTQLNFQKNMLNVQKSAERVAAINELKQELMAEDDSLEKSALDSGNAKLCPCVLGGKFKKADGSQLCDQPMCDSGTEVEFVFIGHDGIKMTGTAQSPAYFDVSGNACTPTDPSASGPRITCGYKTISKFKAHCAGDLAQCDHADFLDLSIEIVPLNGTTEVSYQKTQMMYLVSMNYPPVIGTIIDQTVAKGGQKNVAVNAEAGDPSEHQNFTFEKCESSKSDIATIDCYAILDGKGQTFIKGVAAGTAKISLQINDNSRKNNLSEPVEFNVTVTP